MPAAQSTASTSRAGKGSVRNSTRAGAVADLLGCSQGMQSREQPAGTAACSRAHLFSRAKLAGNSSPRPSPTSIAKAELWLKLFEGSSYSINQLLPGRRYTAEKHVGEQEALLLFSDLKDFHPS